MLLRWGNRHVTMSKAMMLLMIFVPLFIAAGLSVGSMMMVREERPEKLWLLQDDWVLQDRLYRQTHFERAVEEEIVITGTVEGDDLLAANKVAMLSTFALHDDIMAISIQVTDPQGVVRNMTTSDLCLRSKLPFLPDQQQPCVMSTVMAYWKYNISLVKADSNLHDRLTWNNQSDPTTGGPIFRDQVAGGLTFADNTVTGVAAFKLWYYLENSFKVNDEWPGWEDDVIPAWEAVFLDVATRPRPGITVYRHASNSDADVMSDAMSLDLPYVIAALMTVIFGVVFYIYLSPAMFHDGIAPEFGERSLRAFCAVLCAGLTMGPIMGVIGFAGLPFSGVVWYMIFYVLIHLCHGMGLLINALDVVCVALPAHTRLGAALGAVGPTMLTSAVPVMLAFGIIAVLPTALPCVRSLALAGAFGLAMNLFLLFTFFLAILARNIRRINATPSSSTPLGNLNADGGATTSATGATGAAATATGYAGGVAPPPRPPCVGVRAIRRAYKWACRSWVAKSLVVLLVLGMAGDSINGLIAWRQIGSEAAPYPVSSYLYQFYVMEQKYFGMLGVPVDFVFHPMDYSQPENGQKLLTLSNTLADSTWMDGTPSDHLGWYSNFIAFLHSKHIPLPFGVPAPDLFGGFLELWSFDYGEPVHNIFEFWPVDIQFANGRHWHINYSRYQGLSGPIATMDQQAGIVEALHDITVESELNASLYAPPFYIFRTFTTVKQWTIYTLYATGAACLVAVALSVPPMAALFVVLSIGFAAMNTVGLFMHTAGYSLDQTTMPILMFMIPLLTDLLVHLASFLGIGFRLPHENANGQDCESSSSSSSSSSSTVSDKRRSALLSASVAVLSYGPATATLICGCIGTVIGLGVMMSGVISPVLYVFGALTSVMIALACLHVIVLPLFLSW